MHGKTPILIMWASAVLFAFAAAMAALATTDDNEFLRVALPGYLTAIGTVALASVSVWLSIRDSRAATVARSHAAAFALARSMTEAWSIVAKAGPGEHLQIDQWFQDVALYSPDLLDVEVMRRVDDVSKRLFEFDEWSTALRAPKGTLTGPQFEEFDERRRQLLPHLRWLGVTLAAYRNGKPLPPPPHPADAPVS